MKESIIFTPDLHKFKLKRKLNNNKKSFSFNISGFLLIMLFLYGILLIKFLSIRNLNESLIVGSYGVLVAAYIFLRLIISYFHNPGKIKVDPEYIPSVTVGVPAKNEEKEIINTILAIAKSDYPRDKLSVITVDDGSTDKTYSQMKKAKIEARKLGIEVKVAKFKKNKGKREGMKYVIDKTKSDIVIFIDSDSTVDKEAVGELVKYFSDKRVGAVAGHAYVANEINLLTKIQAFRYFISFKTHKAAESVFGNVTCVSGCCAAYRVDYVTPILHEWANQKFLGVRCTYGDDRSLTNLMLKSGFNAVYAPEAISYTFVPENMRQFLKQQLRWKKSWFRETLIACRFLWKKHPLMSIMFYLGFILTLVSPFFVLRALIWLPFVKFRTPSVYLMGLIVIGLFFGAYYLYYTHKKNWLITSFLSVILTLALVWQLPWAIINIKDSKWGTR